MWIKVGVGAVLLGLLVAASSCSDDGPYGTLPSGSSTATASPSAQASPRPTIPAPTMPALARQDSAKGAEAFARFWLIALDYASSTGDTSQFRKLGECRTCIGLAEQIESLYTTGGHVEGGQIEVLRTTNVRIVEGHVAMVMVNYSQREGAEFSANGQIKRTGFYPNQTFLISIRRIDQHHWTVTAVQSIRRK